MKSAAMPRRILFLAASMSGGGAERVFSLLLRRLDRSRFAPALALLDKSGPFLKDIEALGDVDILDLKVKRARYSLPAIAAAVRQMRPDAVVATIGHMNLALMLAKPLLPRATRLIARETVVPSIAMAQGRMPRFFQLLYRALYPRFDAVVCQSRDMREDLVDNFGVPPQRAVLLHNPVDMETVSRQAGAYRPPFDAATKHVVAMGRLVQRKGFDLLLQAFQLLGVPSCQLHILGQGEERQALERQALELGVASRVHFVGFQENPAPWLAGADVFALSSHFEGFPNAVLEAMACGTPVAAFACPGGLNELVLPGENGCLAPVGDVQGLAECLDSLLQTPLDKETVRQSVASRYALADIVRSYEDLLEG